MDQKEIYTSYINEVYKYSYFILKNKEQAEDITSEAFTRFFENKSNIAEEKTKPYVIGIARNLMFERFRDKNFKNINLIDYTGEVMEFEDKDVNFENKIIDESLIKIIKENLNSFNKLSQEILILKIWEELKFDEIAKIVDENVNTIKTIYYKTIEDLKIKLNSNNKNLKLRSVSAPLIFSSILYLSKSEEYKVSAAVINKLFTNNLFIKYLNMNSAGSALSRGSMVAKVGLLGTTAGKIAVRLTAAAIVATSVGIGALVIKDNNLKNGSVNSLANSSSSQFSSLEKSSVSSEITSSSLSSLSSKTASDSSDFSSNLYSLKFSYKKTMGNALASKTPFFANKIDFSNSKITISNTFNASGGPLSNDFPEPITAITKDGKQFKLYISDAGSGYVMYGSWVVGGKTIMINQTASAFKDQQKQNIELVKYIISTMSGDMGNDPQQSIKNFSNGAFNLKFEYPEGMGNPIVKNNPVIYGGVGGNSISFDLTQIMITNSAGGVGGPLSKDFPDIILVTSKDGKQFNLQVRDGNKSGTYTLFGGHNLNNKIITIIQNQEVSKEQQIININYLKFLISTLTGDMN